MTHLDNKQEKEFESEEKNDNQNILLCDRCQNESKTVNKYYFYIGKIIGTYQSGVNVQTSEYEFNSTPITGNICLKCIKEHRKKFLKLIFINAIGLVITVFLSFLFSYLDFPGWKVLFIIVSVFLCLCFFALISLFYENNDEIGDTLASYNYLYKLREMGYTTTATRKGMRNKKYTPIPLKN